MRSWHASARTHTDDPPEKVKNARPDLTVLKDYQKREEEFLRRAADLSEVSALRDQKKEEHEQLKGTRLKKFLDGFNLISLKLKEMYQVSRRAHMTHSTSNVTIR